MACLIFYEVIMCNSISTLILYDWVTLKDVKLHIGFLFDDLTALMLLIILTISLLVHLYAAGYMSHDPFIIRFMSYLGLFTFFMIVLVTSDNFLQLFVGWEGVGVCSYLLINFWHYRIAANKAALKALIMNRIADVFFILGIVLIILTFKTADFIVIFSMVHFFTDIKLNILFINCGLIDVICFFLFIGAMGKSAQVGLHTWLPDAMEGPTPVSALLHAATMVTAGVFLLIRCSFLFEHSVSILIWVSVIGAITALLCSLIAVFQFDVKKIIAYSTCSQLGYMFFSCGLSNYQVALFHLFNHAFFKALLFLGAGCIISALMDEQDIRKMGSLASDLPLTYISIIIGSLAITGFPFLAGFYSKDLVLEIALTRYVLDAFFIYLMGLLAAFFTALYSIRLLIVVFFANNNAFYIINKAKHENGTLMLFPLVVLSMLSVCVGFLFNDLFSGWGTSFLSQSIYTLNHNFVYLENEFLNPVVKHLPFMVSILGFFVGFLLIRVEFKKNLWYVYLFKVQKNLGIYFFFAGFFNFIYNSLFINLYRGSYFINTKIVDKGFLELLGPFGVYKFLHALSFSLKMFTPNVIFISVSYLFLALFILITFVFLKVFFLFLFKESVLFLFVLIIFFFEIHKI